MTMTDAIDAAIEYIAEYNDASSEDKEDILIRLRDDDLAITEALIQIASKHLLED